MIFNREQAERLLSFIEMGGGAGIRVEKLAGDASSRSYFRLELEGANSFILMKLAPEPFRPDEITKGDSPSELPFINVQRFLKRGKLPVPEIFFADVTLRVIILEDLGDTTMESVVKNEPHSREQFYRKAVDLLVEMQSYATSQSAEADCVAFGRKFDYDLLLWEFEHFHQFCILELGRRKPTPAEEKELFAVYREIAETLSKTPYIFTHRDFQSRNLMLQGERLRLIDFQDALLAPMPYDLTALLRDSYVKLSIEETDLFIDYYLEKRKSCFNDGFTRDEFRRWFHLQTIQRKLKDAGRFVYIDRVKKNPKFLPNIPVSLGYAVAALKDLASYEEFREMILSFLGDYLDF